MIKVDLWNVALSGKNNVIMSEFSSLVHELVEQYGKEKVKVAFADGLKTTDEMREEIKDLLAKDLTEIIDVLKVFVDD